MALSKIDVANMLTGEVPNANVATIGVAKGGTGLTSGNSSIQGGTFNHRKPDNPAGVCTP